MAHLSTPNSIAGPWVTRPEKLAKYSAPVRKLIDELTEADDSYWVPDEESGGEQPIFSVGMVAPVNDRFLVLLSVRTDDMSVDPRIVQLAGEVIKKVEETFPELVEWLDWSLSP